MGVNDIAGKLKGYFDLSPFLENEKDAVDSILEGVSFRGPNIVILIIAIFIASLGLNTNSAAVIIGAMLISPLMGPIIGLGLAVGTYNFGLAKRSLRNLALASLFSIIASTVYFLISPVSEGHSELLARTSPTIYDVLIGFFGGGAGIVAIACKQKGNVIPGVAIATALMPPLCTAGYGLATWQLQYFSGALYLFLINSIFIALATLVGVKLFRFTPYRFVDMERRKRVKTWLYVVVTLTLLPSIYLTSLMLRESYFVNAGDAFIEEEFNLPNTQVFAKKLYIQRWQKYMDVTLIGQQVNIDSLQRSLTAMMGQNPALRGTRLTITQGFSTSAIAEASSRGNLEGVFSSALGQIDRQRAEIDSLRGCIASREAFDSLSYVIAPEIKVLYPGIRDFSLGRMMVVDVADRSVDTVNIAIVRYYKPQRMPANLVEYLQTRSGLKDIRVIEG